MQDQLYAAIDVGGTKIYTVIADSNHKILASQRVATAAEKNSDTLITQLVQSVENTLNLAGAKKTDLLAVGVCAAGFYDWHKRILIDSPNLPLLINLHLEKILSKRLGVPVVAENDANAAALAEARCGAGAGYDDVIFVTVSTGIGAGLVLNGQIYRGNCGFAGEIGHMAVKRDGPLCGCGRRGCLETVASGTAIAHNAKELLKTGEDTLLISFADINNGNITAADVFNAAQNNDAAAQRILDEAIYYLGIGLVNLVNLLNPAVLIIGGGVADAGEALLAPLRQIIADQAVIHIARSVVLKKAELGAEAGVMGMLFLLADNIKGGV